VFQLINPSDKDVNQGTLVVFNLDPSVSNDDLWRIFGDHDEIEAMQLMNLHTMCVIFQDRGLQILG